MIQNYNVKKIETSYKPINLSFEEITLLSEDEYIDNEKLIPSSDGYWWLRSPGADDNRAAFVHCGDGYVYGYGDYISKQFGVRPALRILNYHDLMPGDKIKISDYIFTILNGNLALCDTCIGTSIFDYTSNNFKTSHIRKYLYDWAKENGIKVKSID